MTTRKTRKLSREAAAVLAQLHQGPVGLGDVLDLTTSSGDVGRWCRELQQAGYQVVRETDQRGAVRWRLYGGADVGPAQDDVGPLFQSTGRGSRESERIRTWLAL